MLEHRVTSVFEIHGRGHAHVRYHTESVPWLVRKSVSVESGNESGGEDTETSDRVG